MRYLVVEFQGDIVISSFICESSESFLAPEELEKFLSFKFQKRRESYFYGRLAAKKAVRKAYPELNENQILIRNSTDAEIFGKPLVFKNGESSELGQISLSHSHDLAVACFHQTQEIGIDLEAVENRDEFEINFTASEKKITNDMPVGFHQSTMTLLWTAKEAMSKALGKGLSLSTLHMESFLDSKQLLECVSLERKSMHYMGRVFSNQNYFLFSLHTQLIQKEKTYFLTMARGINGDQLRESISKAKGGNQL